MNTNRDRISNRLSTEYLTVKVVDIQEILLKLRGETRALIGGGGGGGVFIYSCSARLISFEMNLKTTDFKRNIHPPINALVSLQLKLSKTKHNKTPITKRK